MIIKRSVNADSRSATDKSIESLTKDTKSHINDVCNCMKWLSDLINDQAHKHDHTKLDMIDEFHRALNSGHIKDTPWYNKHITMERHHLKSYVPDNVNLIDIIEHISDCCMAGLARSGTIYDIDIDPDILLLAVKNTVDLIKNNTTVINDDVNILDDNI